MNNILILPSGFKESLNANEVAQAIKQGITKVLPHANVQAIAIADGGEHTAHILAQQTQGQLIAQGVTGPLGQPISSYFAMLGKNYQHVAVVEVAAAAGLTLIPPSQRNPMYTTSYGIGELIKAAINHGAMQIIVGCGDSGISDGGMGALQALGVKITDQHQQDVGLGGQSLIDVCQLDYAQLVPELLHRQVEIILAVNPCNILCGTHGVAPIFAPQKGASPLQVQQLSTGLEHWAKQLSSHHLHEIAEFDFAYGMGTGASGGLGAGLAAIGAKLCPRFEVLCRPDLLGYDLDTHIQQADLIITAEGAIDAQTLRGKVPAEIARRAAQYQKPVIALAGSLAEDADAVYDLGIASISSIMPRPMLLPQAMQQAEQLLIQATERLIRSVLVGAKIAQQQPLIV